MILHSTAPGPVSNIVWTRQTDTTAVVSWDPPERPNGIITGYFIRLTEYQGTTVIQMNSVGANVTSVDISHNSLGKRGVHYTSCIATPGNSVVIVAIAALYKNNGVV